MDSIQLKGLIEQGKTALGLTWEHFWVRREDNKLIFCELRIVEGVEDRDLIEPTGNEEEWVIE